MNRKGRVSRKDLVLVAVLVCVCLALLQVPTGYENRLPEHSRLSRATIVSTDNSELQQHQIVRTGAQTLEVELEEGPFDGERVQAVNILQGKMEIDEVYVEGQEILLEYTVVDERIVGAQARGAYRLRFELLLILLFALALTVVAGTTGLKALLSFTFAALMIWKVMIPAFLNGYDPIFVALGVVAALTASVSFLVGGVNSKGLVCFVGAFLGLVMTCALAIVFRAKFQLHGAVRPFAEMLLYSGFYYVDLSKLFVAGVFTASSGAVMDLAMDISASMHEVREKHPSIGRWEHFKSGMTVGRAVIGTMTTTLLLAYSGSYVTMLMVFMGQGVPLANVMNLNFVAAEVLNTLVGSFGLVTVAPFTAFTGMFVFGRRRAAFTEGQCEG